VLNAIVGPRGDAYNPDAEIVMDAAEDYFAEQLGWIAATEADMVTALTFNQAGEAAGFARAARTAGLPAVISITVETNGALPNGQKLSDAIRQVDEATDGYPSYFMINCAHPDHFSGLLQDAPWTRRIRGVRANASRRSHAELDSAPELDPGDPHELASQYRELADLMPWLNVFGGCCGSDLRHVTEIARAVCHAESPQRPG
jgi:S-methylmethionine-dependent homocysteine/selenocysteine methylase